MAGDAPTNKRYVRPTHAQARELGWWSARWHAMHTIVSDGKASPPPARAKAQAVPSPLVEKPQLWQGIPHPTHCRDARVVGVEGREALTMPYLVCRTRDRRA